MLASKTSLSQLLLEYKLASKYFGETTILLEGTGKKTKKNIEAEGEGKSNNRTTSITDMRKNTV